MKKIIYILSITFLVLQSCSSGGDDNNTTNSNQTFLEKYANTFWHNTSATPADFDYYGFKNETFFLQISYIETDNNNQVVCGKIQEGVNTDEGVNYNVQITKNSGNELWIKMDYPSESHILKFTVNSSNNQLVLLHFIGSQLYTSETYNLSNLNYNSFCN